MNKQILYIILFALLSLNTICAQQKTVIFWDVSWSMEQRVIDKEFEFLDQYYQQNENSETTLVLFNYKVLEEIIYNIENGDWTALKEKLNNLNYDGATSFYPLLAYTGFNDALLFTDSFQNIHQAKPYTAANQFYIINANADTNDEASKLLAAINEGKYVQLYHEKEITKPIEKPKTNAISDTLVNQLDEVILEGEGKKEKPTVNKKDAIGYAKQSIEGNQIDPSHTNIATAVQGKFSGIKIDGGSSVGVQKTDLSKFYTRGGKFSILQNNYGLIVLDGVPLARSSSVSGRVASTDFINPADIADITVLKGLAATNRYGSEGSNGVILITTKSASAYASGKPKNSALLTNNNYDGKVKVNKNVKLASYVKKLKKNKKVIDAYNEYLVQRNQYKDNVQYFIDVYDFFKTTNPNVAHQILSNIIENPNTSLSEFKRLLFVLSESDNKNMYHEVAKKMLNLYPKRIESYYDVAMAKIAIGEYQAALSLLETAYKKLTESELKTTSFEKVVRDEIKNLLHLHKSKLDYSKLDKSVTVNTPYDARLVFDWTSAQAEFEIQFVNPQNKFFTWKHTSVEDFENIENEIALGYHKNQFEINGNGTGKWQINVKYIGNGTETKDNNVYLKCRVQYNFGKINQTEKTYFIKLTKEGQEEQFFTMNI